jgi:hypothetical protein
MTSSTPESGSSSSIIPPESPSWGSLREYILAVQESTTSRLPVMKTAVPSIKCNVLHVEVLFWWSCTLPWWLYTFCSMAVPIFCVGGPDHYLGGATLFYGATGLTFRSADPSLRILKCVPSIPMKGTCDRVLCAQTAQPQGGWFILRFCRMRDVINHCVVHTWLSRLYHYVPLLCRDLNCQQSSRSRST